MSARDRKILKLLAPVAAVVLFWMLLLNPVLQKRQSLAEPLETARAERDAAVANAAEVAAAKARYDEDYAELVELSKAIPQSVQVSDLMRELNAAARGTGIRFKNITMGGGDQPLDGTDPPPGASGTGSDATGTGTPAPGAAPVTGVLGLEEIPLELSFEGRFFDLADLFRSLKRFVTVADGRLEVQGRLIRITSFSFASATFPNISATVNATVYAAPAAEGPTGGATPVGPRGAERGDGNLEPVDQFSTAAVVQP